MNRDHLHMARLGCDELSDIAMRFRERSAAGAGSASALAVAEAIESVVRQRRAAALVRTRIAAARAARAARAPRHGAADTRWAEAGLRS